MDRPCPEGYNNIITLVYVKLLLEIDSLTLYMGVGLKLPPFINPRCGQICRPCHDISKKIKHLYVSINVFEMALLQ